MRASGASDESESGTPRASRGAGAPDDLERRLPLNSHCDRAGEPHRERGAARAAAASLASPAMTAAVPPPAPTPAPIIAPRLPPSTAPMNRSSRRTRADLRRRRSSRRLAVAVQRFRLNRHAQAVGEDDGVEANAQARTSLELAAGLDERHVAFESRAGRQHGPAIDDHVARHRRRDAVLQLCRR